MLKGKSNVLVKYILVSISLRLFLPVVNRVAYVIDLKSSDLEFEEFLR